jgi:alkylation response protein AidB-like acyl-CoA dehydrogenase
MYQFTLDWIEENWDDSLTLRQWWQMMNDARLSFPRWPSAWFGRDCSEAEQNDIARAFADKKVLGPPTGLGVLMGAPVTMTFGTEEQKQRWLPNLANGTEGWCQLFSEPGAGSDLASVSCRAERDGDEWVINGQKVWTSGALHSTRGMLVARNDFDQPKHKGLTYFIIDLEQPGVEIRPIKQMNGLAHFNEVFFNDARVSDADRVSEINNGWAITAATLGFERSGLSEGAGGGVRVPAGKQAGNLDRAVGELLERVKASKSHPDEYGGLLSTLQKIELPQGLNAIQRQKMIDLSINERIAEMTRERIASTMKKGQSPGAEASTMKLHWTNGLRISRDLGMELLGADGMLTGDDLPVEGKVQHFFLSMPSASIAGGSDEVQRNIIGEKTLGLPKDAQTDPKTPFKDIPKN